MLTPYEHPWYVALRKGEYYKLRCPIEAEAKTGNNWADVH